MSSPQIIIALTAHARDVAASDRQGFAERARGELTGSGLLLETCHRVELYTAVGEANAMRLAAALPDGGHALHGEAAIRHAVAVATGRDSVVVGEDQILHQLRQALGATTGTLDPILERLFTMALRAGRRARSWQHGPSRSLADVAVGVIERQIPGLRGQEILVVGAGRMGGLAARLAAVAGASVAVANRSSDRAADLAKATGARVENFDPRGGTQDYVGIVLALGGPWSISAETVEALHRSSTIVVDLSVPPAVPKVLATLLGPRLTTADDLARVEFADWSIRDRALAKLDGLIERTTAEFIAWLDGREGRVAARALVERANREREAELAELWRHLPDLDPTTRATIDEMSRHLTDRLLRDPLERLGSDADGRHERAVRELWAL